MERLCSRILGVVAGVLVASSVAAAPASAESGFVDGSITAEGETCSWTDGVTSDAPPNALTIDRSTINAPGGNLNCTGDVTANLNNDPNVTFDDNNGTATADRLDVTITKSGVQCQYAADNVSAQRDGDTRHYTGSATVSLVEGGVLCPASTEASADLTFR